MKNILIFGIAICCSIQNAVSQDSLKPVKRIRINDVGAYLGLFTEIVPQGSLDDFRNFYPQSTLLNNDLSDYSGHLSNKTYNLTPLFAVYASFKFSDKYRTNYKHNLRLRTGLSVQSFQLNSYYGNTVVKAYTSTQQNTLYIDSVTARSYGMSYAGTQIRLDVSFLLSTNQEKRRLALYTGAGISAGISVNTNGYVNYNVNTNIQFRDGTPNYSDNLGKSKYTYEYLKGPQNVGLSGYVPLGADLRLGRKRTFWKRAHLYYELRPTFNLTIVPGTKSFSTFGLQHGWGLRFTL